MVLFFELYGVYDVEMYDGRYDSLVLNITYNMHFYFFIYFSQIYNLLYNGAISKYVIR
jgi:hypothetical protein